VGVDQDRFLPCFLQTKFRKSYFPVACMTPDDSLDAVLPWTNKPPVIPAMSEEEFGESKTP
jgi:hypothetical protein